MDYQKLKVLRLISLGVVIVLMAASILTYLDVINLNIVNRAYVPPIIDLGLNFLMFMVNLFFIFSITLNIFDSRIIKILICYVPIYLVCTSVMRANLVTSTLIPFLFTLCIAGKYGASYKSVILRWVISSVFIIIYQQISGFIKLSHMGVKYFDFNAYTLLSYSIDFYLFLLILYEGVKYNVARKYMVFSKEKSVSESCKQNEDILDLTEHTKFQKFMFLTVAMAYQLSQLAVVLAIGLLNNVLLETCSILLTFWVTRYVLKDSWHSESLKWCSIMTFVSFYVLSRVTLPYNISLFASITLGCVFAYILYYIATKDVYSGNFEHLEFDVETATEEQIRERCKDLKTSQSFADFAVIHFSVNKRDVFKTVESYPMEIQSIRNKACLCKKKLNNT